MLRKLLDRITRKSGLAQPQPWLKEALGVEESWAGVDITPAASLASSTVAACIRLLSESVASLPLHVYRQEGASKLKAPEHGLYGLLHDKPNSYQTSATWRSQMLWHVLLHGNSYSIIERDLQGRVSALWPVDPQSVVVKADGGELVYEVWIGGKRERFAYWQVLHVKGPSTDGITGMSIVRMARQGIGLDLALTQSGASLYKNRARPGLVITSPEIMGDEARQNLRKVYSEGLATALNAGKTVVLDGGLTLSSVGFSNDDAQWLQSRQFAVQDVCRWFRVNPHLVGDPSRLAYASSEAEFIAFLTHTLRPWLVNIEAEMNAVLLPERTNFFIEFDANGMARGDQHQRYESYAKGLEAGFLTVADVRAWENLPFIPGTDSLPSNSLPSKEVQNAAA
jgi:HK97 family phage portal protein